MLNVRKDFLTLSFIRLCLPKLMEDAPGPQSDWSGEGAGEYIVRNNPALVLELDKRTY